MPTMWMIIFVVINPLTGTLEWHQFDRDQNDKQFTTEQQCVEVLNELAKGLQEQGAPDGVYDGGCYEVVIPGEDA